MESPAAAGARTRVHDFTFILLIISWAATVDDSGALLDSKAFKSVASKALNPSSFWFTRIWRAPWRNTLESDPLLIKACNKCRPGCLFERYQGVGSQPDHVGIVVFERFYNDGIDPASLIPPSALAASQRTRSSLEFSNAWLREETAGLPRSTNASLAFWRIMPSLLASMSIKSSKFVPITCFVLMMSSSG